MQLELRHNVCARDVSHLVLAVRLVALTLCAGGG